MQVIRHNSERGQWEMAFAPPHPRLAGLVDTYIAYDERNTAFTRRHELPGLNAVMIVNLGDPITIVDTAGFVIPVGTGCGFAAGLSDAYAISESGGSQRGLQVMFTPQGARRFFRLPMQDLTNRVFLLSDLLGPAAALRLIEGLQAANDWETCFAWLDAAIAAHVASREAVDLAGIRNAGWALRQIAGRHGDVSIAALAGEVGCSRKHLAVLFREHVGLSPGTVAGLLRFRHALELIDEAQIDAVPAKWTDVALAAGYYDQAHFNRDFRRLTGCTPGDYLAARLQGQVGLPVG
ncbi:MAG: helix-turn-helix domain-containing protein [Ferrovibrio sp.]|uniref:helix-turn-helix domain-containing protein n=1 Tax=Ferrovibrio sp. TaxID=1917215 RepID=UPI003919A2E0